MRWRRMVSYKAVNKQKTRILTAIKIKKFEPLAKMSTLSLHLVT